MKAGRDCTIMLKTQNRELVLPYMEETLREAAALLKEEAAIEGDGICRAIRQGCGIAGCVVTPLTLETAPFLFALTLGGMAQPFFVSETRNLYRHHLNLLPMEDSPAFEVIQDRGTARRLYEGCRVKSFELRILRDEALSLKLDITGEQSPVSYSLIESLKPSEGEFFKENGVSYTINGAVQKNIYGFSVAVYKEGGTKSEVFIHRSLGNEDLPSIIENLTITAKLYRGKYEERHYGLFRLSFSHLVLMADETTIDSADAVIGPLRYYGAGGINAEVFTTTGEER